MAAKRLLDFITSPAFQAKLLDFPTSIDPAFLPDAQPDAEAVSSLPQTAKSGKKLRLEPAARQPASRALRSSTACACGCRRRPNGGKSYRNVGRSKQTDANGGVLLRPRISSDTRYRLTNVGVRGARLHRLHAPARPTSA